ncbi:MAG: phosphatidylinositol-specific phospholipase C/glycerophosphodiester phosphodiesterase family protein [Candidatus Hydrogenedentota bacterium]
MSNASSLSWFVAAVTGVLVAAPGMADEEPMYRAQKDSAEVIPLERAFAHNDYWHSRPLFDALDRGFAFVEADVFRVGDDMLVGHAEGELAPNLTLEGLYLDPLLERVREHGQVHPDGPETFWLMLDLKSPGEYTWPVLHETLAEYEEMLAVVRDGTLNAGPVRVVISGDRPIGMMREEETLYAGVDGRLTDLDSDDPPYFMPWISGHWFRHFDWDGQGAMPAGEREKLADIVEQVHESGRMLRFWATPEDPDLWTVLLEHDVDMLNTDHLDRLQEFLLEADATLTGD